ncbi:MAG TPA: hypothetical protein VG168_02945 [Bryobacteraceae bacterium]|nr:hypothetical protein [Bryobacteraceae bacterium]
MLTSAVLSAAQDPQEPPPFPPAPKPPGEDDEKRLPDGKSQNNAIAKQAHEAALKDADQLIALAQQLKEQLVKAGDYVVPVGCVKKTEDIEKLARKIRGHLNQ